MELDMVDETSKPLATTDDILPLDQTDQGVVVQSKYQPPAPLETLRLAVKNTQAAEDAAFKAWQDAKDATQAAYEAFEQALAEWRKS